MHLDPLQCIAVRNREALEKAQGAGKVDGAALREQKGIPADE